MRHRKSGVKLNRTSSHRKAMFRNMVTSLLKHEKIKTTDVKAKALRTWVDHIITLAKRGDLHARRQAMSIVREKKVVHKLFAEAEDKFGGRKGGYTRITKIGLRKGDAAPVSVIELITAAPGAKKKLFKEEEKELVAPAVQKDAGSSDEKAGTERPAEDDGIDVASAETDARSEESEEVGEDARGENTRAAEERVSTEAATEGADDAKETAYQESTDRRHDEIGKPEEQK